MTVATTTSRFSSSGNGSTTDFSFNQKFYSDSDIKVVVRTTATGAVAVSTLNVGHTIVSKVSDGNGGYSSATVRMASAPATGTTLTRYLDPALTQEFDFQSESNPLNALNRKCDLIELKLQRLDDRADRTPIISEAAAASGFDGTIEGVPTAGQAIIVNGALNGWTLGTPVAGGTVSAAMLPYVTASAPPLDYPATVVSGMVADGSTDDTAAVQTWLQTAAAYGLWANGLGKTIAVTGDLDISSYARLKLKDVTFKQLSPSSARKCLYASGNQSLILRNVKVLRNGDGTSGDLNNAAGIYLNNCPDAILEDCEVSGNDKGNGFVLVSCPRSHLIRPYAHDIRYVHTAETDDCVQGIWFISSDDFLCDNPRVEGLGRVDQTSDARDRFGRAIAISGCRGGVISAPEIYRSDQGVDITGSGSNSNIVVLGGNIRHIYSHGVKFANSATGCKVIGVNVEAAGLNGFIASGPASSQLNATQNIVVEGCTARNTGCAKQQTASSVRAFSAERGTGSSPYNAYPKGITFSNCDAVADEGSSTVTVASTTTLTVASPMPVLLGARVRFTTSGSLPTGLATSTDYWLVPIRDTMTVSVATSYINAIDGTVVSTLAGGSGTHTMTLFQDMYDGYYTDVATAQVDTEYPNIAQNCRARGYTNKAFNGIHAPIVHVAQSTTLAINDDGSLHDLVLDTASIDSMGLYNTSTGVFTVPHSGLWSLWISVEWTSNDVGTRRLQVQANTGSGFANASPLVNYPRAATGQETVMLYEHIAWYARGSTLKARVSQNSGGGSGSLTFTANCKMTLRPASVFGGTI